MKICRFLLISALGFLTGCAYHHQVTRPDGTTEKTHIGFNEFSDDKEISLITIN